MRLADFEEAMARVRPSVAPAHLRQFEEWNELHGTKASGGVNAFESATASKRGLPPPLSDMAPQGREARGAAPAPAPAPAPPPRPSMQRAASADGERQTRGVVDSVLSFFSGERSPERPTAL